MQSLVQIIRLALRFGRRAALQPANQLLSICIIVCTCVTASLSFFAASVQTSLDNDIANFLGAPMVVRSSQPIASDLLTALPSQSAPVQTSSFTTGAVSNQHYQSVSLKAISSAYPLQGKLTIRNRDGARDGRGAQLQPSDAWLDRRALDELDLVLGDQLQIGKTVFNVAGEILYEPDRLTQLQHVLPRVMVSMHGLAQTQINLDNNRGEHRAMFAGDSTSLALIETQLPNLLPFDYKILKPSSGNHPFSRISSRAQRLLTVVLMLILLLCSGAAATLADHSARSYALPTAVLRCMGIKRRIVSWALCLQLMILALLMSTTGCLMAWLFQPLLVGVMEPHMTLTPSRLSARNILIPISLSALMVVAFVVPKLHRLGSMPINQLLREQHTTAKHAYLPLLCTASLVIALLFLSSDNYQLTAIIVGAVIVLGVSSVLVGWALSKLSAQCHLFFRGPLKIAVRSIGRSPMRHSAPLTSVAIAMMAILMTVTLRGSFLDVLQIQRLENDGNFLFTGLPAQQKEPFINIIQTHGAELKGLYPTVSARLSSVNGVPIDQALQRESDTREELRSKVRLSWSPSAPDNNTMLQGSWPTIGSHEVSVEQEVMSDLGLRIGDQLVFQVGQSKISTTINSTRKYNGGESRVMFWFMFAPDTLAALDHQFLGGILIHRDPRALLGDLTKAAPQIRINNLEAQIAGIRAIMIVLTRLLNTTLLLLMIGALMVIIASSYANSASRQARLNLMRALGLQKRQCYAMNLAEQLTLGLVACSIGILGVQMIGGALFKSLFALPYQLDWTTAIVVTALISASFTLLGWLFTFRRLQQPVGVNQAS